MVFVVGGGGGGSGAGLFWGFLWLAQKPPNQTSDEILYLPGSKVTLKNFDTQTGKTRMLAGSLDHIFICPHHS